jgi:hypothetical protein
MTLPPQRSADNLIYLIAPLGYVLLLFVHLDIVSIGGEATYDWIAPYALLTSIIAVVLYMVEPVLLIFRFIYRKIPSKIARNLEANFTSWSHLPMKWRIPKDHIREHYVERLFSNAVSSSFITKRMHRLRALIYFMLTLGVYAYVGWKLFLTSDNGLLTITAVLSLYIVLFIIGIRRRAYFNHLGGDIMYVTEFMFASLIFHVDNMERTDNAKDSPFFNELTYFDSLLSRGDLDLFLSFWGNIRDRLTYMANLGFIKDESVRRLCATALADLERRGVEVKALEDFFFALSLDRNQFMSIKCKDESILVLIATEGEKDLLHVTTEDDWNNDVKPLLSKTVSRPSC